jgi:Zn finger protein HypA/HybF involved in hydrogenase expression
LVWKGKIMNCWHCGTELIWGGDHDMEDNEEYDIITNLSCPNCHSAVDVYHPSEQLIKEYKKHEKNKKIST